MKKTDQKGRPKIVAKKKVLSKRDQNLRKGRSVVGRIALLMFVLCILYVIIGLLNSGKVDKTVSIKIEETIEDVRSKFFHLEDIKMQKSNIEGISAFRYGTSPFVSWSEIYSENGVANFQGDWISKNEFKVKLIDSNLDVKAEWTYSLKGVNGQTRLTIKEVSEIDNIGYRMLLFFDDSFGLMEEELESFKN